jgi:hypothetical protein
MGLIKDLPIEIQRIVFQRQKEAGNISNKYIELDQISDNFNWNETPEDPTLWEEINIGNYKLFYDLYPNLYPEKKVYTLQDFKEGRCVLQHDKNNKKSLLEIFKAIEHRNFLPEGTAKYYQIINGNWTVPYYDEIKLPIQNLTVFLKELEVLTNSETLLPRDINWDVIVEVSDQEDMNELYTFARKYGKLSYMSGIPSFYSNFYFIRLEGNGGHCDKEYYKKSYPNLPTVTFKEFFNNLNINKNEVSNSIIEPIQGRERSRANELPSRGYRRFRKGFFESKQEEAKELKTITRRSSNQMQYPIRATEFH